MRLKRVKLFGFKTFADKTEFDVDGDMIAVVGPNGCGKSNLVDAILWGLGEGSVKHLRASSSQDVIFSGSSRRKAVGFAEVTLLFDNEDGALPIDSSEVSISRKLTRSGDSDYYINRQHCRLRDILDLLADSGLGRAGYAIVGQKEIDQALAASPEDRRAWVDEAAGVQRYRVRKIDALKRLQSAHDHLDRVSDIIHELDTQREPLREEAEVAKRYKSIQSSLREVETGLLIIEVAKSLRDVQALEERINESVRLASDESRQADELEDQAKARSDEAAGLERDLDVQRGRQQSAITAYERAGAAVRLLEQKLESLNDLEKNIGEESEGARLRIIEAEAEAQEARVEAGLEEEALERLRDECAGAGSEAAALRGQLRSAESELSQARERHANYLRHCAELQHRDQRLQDLGREIEGAKESIPDAEAATAEAQTNYDEILGRLQEAEKAVSDCREGLQAMEAQEHEESQRVRETLSEKAALEGRARGIEATIETHEGLNQGARAVLESVERGLLPSNYRPVGEAVEVEKKYAAAIETALGQSSNDLIVPTEADAKAAIELLKQNRLGRATFQPLPLMRRSDPSPELQRVAKQPGVVGRASELVKCKPEYRPVIESLLGRVLVVESLDRGLALAKTAGWSRIVTLDGEVLHSSGAVTGGHAARQHYGLVQRKADLNEIRKSLGRLESEVAKAEEEKAARADRKQNLQAMLTTASDKRKELELELREAREWLNGVAEELNGTKRTLAKLEAELAQLQAAVPEKVGDVDLSAFEAKRDELLKAIAAKSADAEGAETRLREAESRWQAARSRAQQSERRLAAAREAEKSREAKIVNLGPERDRVKVEIQRARADSERATSDRLAAEGEIAKLNSSRQAKVAEAQELLAKARGARQNAQACGDAAHQAELARARADAKRAASLQRLVEEYGLTEADAIEQEPHTEVPADAASLVSRLRRELKALGDVNLGAIEAFDRLTERYAELTAQREDILQGIEQVEASVKELDGLTRERFVSTFEKLQVAFEETYQKLFGGGEGKISLNRPDDILETGIEISVTLPGKKQQRLELLSGGERSLCATAFLFALLKVKPSPLVILDEVDAPLDGRNVERYIELLKEFAGITQFILITHNPTTIEAAPLWLGVTMQDGVSTLIPAKFENKAAVEHVLEGNKAPAIAYST